MKQQIFERLNIKEQVFLAMACGCAVLFISCILVFSYKLLKSNTQLELEKLDLMLESKNHAVSQYFMQRKNTLRQVFLSSARGGNPDTLAITDLKNTLDTAMQAPTRIGIDFDRILYINPDNRKLVDISSPRNPSVKDNEYRKWLTGFREQNTEYSIIPAPNRNSVKLIVAVRCGQQSAYSGVLLGWLNTNAVYRQLNNDTLPGTPKFLLSTPRGFLAPDQKSLPLHILAAIPENIEVLAKIRIGLKQYRIRALPSNRTVTTISLYRINSPLGAYSAEILFAIATSIFFILLFLLTNCFNASVNDLAGKIRTEESSEHSFEITRKDKLLDREIHEKQQIEKALSRLGTAIDQLAESVIITDTDGNIVYANPAFERITGYQKDEYIGRNCRFLKSDRHDIQFYTDLWHTLRTGNGWKGRFINRKKDGTIFQEEATISPIRDPEGTITNYVAVKRDVTEENSLKTQLRHAQKMEALGTLAGGIAHDFNNILQAILGYADLARHELQADTEVHACIEEVYTAGKRAKELVKQILTFSRQTEQERKPVKIHLILKEAVKLISNSFPSTIKVSTNVDANCNAVIADPTQIHQVIMNLCTNAYHAMRDKGGVLSVSLREEHISETLTTAHSDLTPGHYTVLTISDTGHGMDRETLERIFDPYFTTKRPDEGTGLGLATTHGIIAAHKGTVTVSSKPGEGSIFKIYFPTCREQAVSMRDTGLNLRGEISGHENILFIDDEAPIAELGRNGLERFGYHVTSRTSSVEALEAFKSGPEKYDVVITDHTMPNMTGAELAREMLKIRPDLPVIICTGFSETITEEQAKAIGVRDFVMKPSLPRDLAKSIRKIMNENTA